MSAFASDFAKSLSLSYKRYKRRVPQALHGENAVTQGRRNSDSLSEASSTSLFRNNSASLETPTNHNRVLTSASPPPRKLLQPPCWKKSYGLSLIVFMMGPQFKLTRPSPSGISTELQLHHININVFPIATGTRTPANSSHHQVGHLVWS